MRETFLPLSIALGILAFGLTARWYLMPALRRLTRAQALTPLLLFHSFRYIGLAFLIPGLTTRPLSPAFAVPAAYGDLAAALLAMLAALALRSRWHFATMIVWLFNIVGSLDLLNAPCQGLR